MTKPQQPRWYCVNNMGMATLCANQADAENVASDCDTEWPRQSPHRAVQLVELSELEKERAARQEAQQRLADAQELAAKSGLAHRMAVQAAVAEAVADEREACAVVCEGMHEEDRPSDYAYAIRERGAAMTPPATNCECHRCISEKHLVVAIFGTTVPISATKMILCPVCGNKRCPHASDHDLPCTGSNEPGQPGSVYQRVLP